MSKSDVLILPVKEILTPFTGRQMLEAQLAELRKRIEEPELQAVVVMSQQQLLTINRRAAAADYYMGKVQEFVGELLGTWDEANSGENYEESRGAIDRDIKTLVAFVTKAEEPGDTNTERFPFDEEN